MDFPSFKDKSSKEIKRDGSIDDPDSNKHGFKRVARTENIVKDVSGSVCDTITDEKDHDEFFRFLKRKVVSSDEFLFEVLVSEAQETIHRI